MTGFARVEGAHDRWRWTWELKSVNSRGLELRARLPQGFDSIEISMRKALQAKLKRGAVTANLSLAGESGEAGYRVNEKALLSAITAVETISSHLKCDPPRAEGILALRGVMEPIDNEESDEARAELIGALLASFEETVEGLLAARISEGSAIHKVLTNVLDEIESLTGAAQNSAGATPTALRNRIATQLSELLEGSAIPEDRLAQEAALLAVKADVREEIDRLNAHVVAARTLLKKKGAIGRELDFLSQEFNREANTLCSKAQDMGLKRIGLELKKAIDQLREQVQNVE
ncbi:MAG: YicC/YloC family endoribonuclease [Hyphococcus sp.]